MVGHAGLFPFAVAASVINMFRTMIRMMMLMLMIIMVLMFWMMIWFGIFVYISPAASLPAVRGSVQGASSAGLLACQGLASQAACQDGPGSQTPRGSHQYHIH